MTLTSDPISPIPVGSQVDLTCIVVLSSQLVNVTSSIGVTVEWSTSGTILFNNGATMYEESPPTYSDLWRLRRGSFSSDGSYTCQAKVVTLSPFFVASRQMRDTIVLSISKIHTS